MVFKKSADILRIPLIFFICCLYFSRTQPPSSSSSAGLFEAASNSRRKHELPHHPQHRGCWHQEDSEDGLRWPSRLPDPCETPTLQPQNLLKISNNILNSPTASALPPPGLAQQTTSNLTSSGRLLPNVPKRFVVPRVSAKDLEGGRRPVDFEDENNAVTHLGGLQR